LDNGRVEGDNQPETTPATKPKTGTGTKFPSAEDAPRLNAYGYHKRLFKGEHFTAFRIQIDDAQYNKEYQRLRYITANFSGLISKVVTDLLFLEPPKIQVKDGDQAFIDALKSENKMRVGCWEHALTNSYYGDALFKIRTGYRHPNNPDATVIIDQVTPRIYFPVYDGNNVTGEPTSQELCWVIMLNDKPYLRKEIHTPGKIQNQVFMLEGTMFNGYEVKGEEDLNILGIPGLLPEQDTGIDRSLLIHIPNWRGGESAFGISDYYDLDSLFYAINNRLSKVDNILDKHGDPILMVPPGVIDEDGKVRKKTLGVIELGEGEDGKPEYITWDANLESAFKQIDRLIDVTCMISETSPIIAGVDKGGAIESGRALKYKMLRTLAKAQRKQLYYTDGLTEVYYVAQLMAKEHKVKVDGIGLSKEPVKPEIIWSDGLPADMTESIDNEGKRIDQGTTTKIDAIMRLDDVDEATAKLKAAEIDKEGQVALESQMALAGKQFGKGVDGGGGKTKPPPPPGKPPAIN
jgi:hypothetical protein